MQINKLFISLICSCFLITPLISFAIGQDIVYNKIIYDKPSNSRDAYKVSIKVDADLLVTNIVYTFWKEDKDVFIYLDEAQFINQGKPKENINLQQFLKLLVKLKELDLLLSNHHQDKSIQLRLNTIDELWLDVREKVLSNNSKIDQRFAKLKKMPGAEIAWPKRVSRNIEDEIIKYLKNSQNIKSICQTLVSMDYTCKERTISRDGDNLIFDRKIWMNDVQGAWLSDASTAPNYGVDPSRMRISILFTRNK